jgi:uncharacterized protein YkwD
MPNAYFAALRRSRKLLILLLAGVAAFAISAVYAPPASAAIPTEAQLNAAVYARISTERRVNNLPALHLNAKLVQSAYHHSLLMRSKATMSHQLPGEAALGNRITASGYRWRAAAENIAWSTNMTPVGASNLEALMYYEKAPNDGHRRNILNPAYRDVGISVVQDFVHHRIWLTVDFGTPA